MKTMRQFLTFSLVLGAAVSALRAGANESTIVLSGEQLARVHASPHGDGDVTLEDMMALARNLARLSSKLTRQIQLQDAAIVGQGLDPETNLTCQSMRAELAQRTALMGSAQRVIASMLQEELCMYSQWAKTVSREVRTNRGQYLRVAINSLGPQHDKRTILEALSGAEAQLSVPSIGMPGSSSCAQEHALSPRVTSILADSKQGSDSFGSPRDYYSDGSVESN